jgi:nitroreductase
MKIFKNIIKKLFNLATFCIKKKVSGYQDNKLGSLLRAKLHSIEKIITEEEVDFLNMIYARMLYFEAQKRNLLSGDEINWCKKILFGVIEQNEGDLLAKKKNNLFENIVKQRRSIRKWKNIKIKKEEFERLVDAARWAPSSCNRQPWHFLLIQDKDKIEFLSKMRGQAFIKNAPSCLLVLIDLESYDEIAKYYFTYLDAGVAIQNILLMAKNMNLGACFVNLAPVDDFRFKKEQIKRIFKIPSTFELIGIIPIGKPDDNPNPPGRKDISSIIHFENF